MYRSRSLTFLLAMLLVLGIAVEAGAVTYNWVGNDWSQSFKLIQLWKDSLNQSPASDAELDNLMSDASLGAIFTCGDDDMGIRGRDTTDGLLPNGDVAITINAPFYYVGEPNHARGMSFKDQFKDFEDAGAVSTYTFTELYFQGRMDASDCDLGTTRLAGNMVITGPAEFVSNSNSVSNPFVLDTLIDASRVDEVDIFWYQQGNESAGPRTNDSELHLNNGNNAFFGKWVLTTTASALVDGCLGDADVEVRGAQAFSTDPNITWPNGVDQGVLELRSSGAIAATAKLELMPATFGTLAGKVVVDTGVAASVRQLVIDGTRVGAGTYGSADYPERIEGAGTITVADVNATAVMTMECKDHLGATIAGDAGLMPRVGTKAYKAGYAARIRAKSTMAISGVGYTFSKWQVGGADYSTAADTTVTMDTSKTITAVYTKASGASQPDPANKAGAVSIMTGISWTPDPAATTQSVYFGTSTAVYGTAATPVYVGDGSLSSLTNTQLGGAMKESSNYYWQVRSDVGSDAKPQWVFTTGKVKATTPSPANEATGQATDVTLQWSSPDAGATSFDVYFGTDRNAVENGLVTPVNVAVAQLDKTGLLRGVWYYWRVDCQFPGKTAVGDVWGFRVNAYKLHLNTDTLSATDDGGSPLAGVTASFDDDNVAVFKFTSFNYDQQYDVNVVGSKRLAIWSDSDINFGGFLDVSAPMNNAAAPGQAIAGGYIGGDIIIQDTTDANSYRYLPIDPSRRISYDWGPGDSSYWRDLYPGDPNYRAPNTQAMGPGRGYTNFNYQNYPTASFKLQVTNLYGTGGTYGGGGGNSSGTLGYGPGSSATAYASFNVGLPGVYGQKEVYELWGGSGGTGGGSQYSTDRTLGGAGGGGVVEFFAKGDLTIGANAQILSKGGETVNVEFGSNAGYCGGAGSGGSIRLAATGNVTIAGKLAADGGKGGDTTANKPTSSAVGAGGGGGRVAIYKGGTLNSAGAAVSAAGGPSGDWIGSTAARLAWQSGQNGTVYGLEPGEGAISMITGAHYPIPADGDRGIEAGTAELTWLPGLGSTTSTVYFGTTTSPGLLTSTGGGRARKSASASIVINTKYYWRVDCDGVTGPLWTFRSTGYEAKNPTPATGAQNVTPTGLQLRWEDGYPDPNNITKREVFFGTDQIAVANATTTSSLKIATVTDKNNIVVNVPTLTTETPYYWRVDTFATVTPAYIDGLVWNFTTRPPVCQGVLAGDFNSDCKINFVDFALLAANWKVCNLPDPLDCD